MGFFPFHIFHFLLSFIFSSLVLNILNCSLKQVFFIIAVFKSLSDNSGISHLSVGLLFFFFFEILVLSMRFFSF